MKNFIMILMLFILAPFSFACATATFDSVIVENNLTLSSCSANTVPYFDGSKNLVCSAVTPTQLSYVDFTSSGQTQLNSKQPLITAGTTSQYYRGDKSFQTLDTSVVPENGNLYFTNGRAQGAVSASSPLSYAAGVFSCLTAGGSQAGCLSSADWNTFNSKEPGVGPANVGKSLYLDISRSDSYTPDGSELHPFKNPDDAAALIVANGDNDSTHPYTLLVKPGTYGALTLSNSALSYVNVVGLGGSNASGVSFSSVNFTGANLFRGGLKGINAGTVTISPTIANSILYATDCKFGTTNISNVFEVDISNTQVGAFNITNVPGLVFFQNGYLGVTGATSVVGSSLIMQSSSLLSSVTIDSTSGFFTRNGVRMTSGTLTINGVAQLYQAWISAPIVLNTGGSILNRGSFIDPANISGTLGLAGYTQGTTAQMFGFTPTTASQWSTVPTHIKGALDGLRVLSQSAVGSQPACAVGNRGLAWLVQGGAGVADIYQICQKDAADVYSWTTH